MTGTFTKKIIGDELYLYDVKGELIFKRWITTNISLVFTPFPYGKDTLVSISNNENTNEIKITKN